MHKQFIHIFLRLSLHSQYDDMLFIHFLFFRKVGYLLFFDSLQMSSQASSDTRYNPFKYPPDYNLARIHQKASMPGIPSKQHPVHCPCCNEKVKEPFKSWWGRSIEKDFSKYGGAVVVYFWLLKLYLLAAILIILIYGAYLHYLSGYYCDLEVGINVDQTVCSKLWGFWIVTNEDLYDLIEKEQNQGTEVRYFTLRSITFFILLAVNYLSLFIVKWYKLRYPAKKTIANFSLIFKNLKNDEVQPLLDQIKQKIGQFEYKEAFFIKKIQPFYTQYQRKLQTYYACKLQDNVKKYANLLKQLHTLDKSCSETEDSFYNDGNRAIIVFNDIATKEKVYQLYKINKWKQVKMFFSTAFQVKHGTYCEHCPQPSQIIWNNIGIIEKQGFKVKVLSVIYLILIMAFLILILYFLLSWLYKGQMQEPYRSIIQNVILIFLVVIAISFRGWMNRLSQMRFPNTYTRRTMFIVITTVLFHFIFYLFLPSGYLRFQDDMRGSILNLISNQALTFINVQIILSAFDLMYCCWNRKRAMIENQDKPIGCQKILHEKIQYPRFPIQFKLIILFKIWSFITFFAFHVPLVLLFILLALIFLYVKDRFNLYYHYRMQMIDNEVEFKFLKIYANVFTIYLYLTFVFTQHNFYEYTLGAVVTIAFVVIQLMYFGKLNYKEQIDEEDEPLRFSQIEDKSFSRDYETFLNNARNDLVDVEIKEYLSKQGYGTMKTEQSLSSQLMSH